MCFWALSIVLFLFKTHRVSETGFSLYLQAEPTQLGPIDRATPYLQTPEPIQDTRQHERRKMRTYIHATSGIQSHDLSENIKHLRVWPLGSACFWNASMIIVKFCVSPNCKYPRQLWGSLYIWTKQNKALDLRPSQWWASEDIFWDVMSCNLIDRYQNYIGTCHLHILSWR
jgi:hypothetical protein